MATENVRVFCVYKHTSQNGKISIAQKGKPSNHRNQLK